MSHGHSKESDNEKSQSPKINSQVLKPKSTKQDWTPGDWVGVWVKDKELRHLNNMDLRWVPLQALFPHHPLSTRTGGEEREPGAGMSFEVVWFERSEEIREEIKSGELKLNLGTGEKEVEGDVRRAKKKKGVQLTSRDLCILEFILEMKFSDLESVHQKFFLELRSGEKSKSDWWAGERIGLLRRHGFLTAKRISFSGTSYFQTTELGLLALKSMWPEKTFVRVSKEIDIRFFEHDRRVLKSKVMLEALGKATDWQSERRLKSESSLKKGISRDYQPDAIYVNSEGKRVAFELELSPKTKSRYDEKASHYVWLCRYSKDEKSFVKTLFVTVHDSVFRTLKEVTAVFRELF